jgi:triphosphoribosyl-dephospho-CoA synthase
MDDTMTVEIAFHVQTASVWEACARKLGNVHRNRDFAGTSLTDFLISAAAIGPAFTTEATVGQTVLRAVTATRAVVGQNTNLGIVLALAPLARCRPGKPLRNEIGRVLAELTVADAADVYEAIRIANPGGLGSAESQDVNAAPTVTLREAMTLAAGRDRIANLYAADFDEVFETGLPAFREALRHGSVERAAIETHLRLLAAGPDSLITRKCGDAVAADVSRRTAGVLAAGGLDTAAGRTKGRELDAYLRSDGNRLNPGTTADLVAAVLFVALRERIVTPGDQFPWAVEDWL